MHYGTEWRHVVSVNIAVLEGEFAQIDPSVRRTRLTSIPQKGYGASGCSERLFTLRTYVFYPSLEPQKEQAGGVAVCLES